MLNLSYNVMIIMSIFCYFIIHTDRHIGYELLLKTTTKNYESATHKRAIKSKMYLLKNMTQ